MSVVLNRPGQEPEGKKHKYNVKADTPNLYFILVFLRFQSEELLPEPSLTPTVWQSVPYQLLCRIHLA